MEKNYITDLKHLIDINKTEVLIVINNCFEFQYPTSALRSFLVLMENLEKHLTKHKDIKPGSYFLWNDKNVDMDVLSNLLKKLRESEKNLSENDRYVRDASEKLKQDKGWTEDSYTQVGLPKGSVVVTLEELITFYDCLEMLEEKYCDIKEEIYILLDSGTYFRCIENVKKELESRLAYAIINTYNFRQYELSND